MHACLEEREEIPVEIGIIGLALCPAKYICPVLLYSHTLTLISNLLLLKQMGTDLYFGTKSFQGINLNLAYR